MTEKNNKKTGPEKQKQEAFERYINMGLTYDYLYEEYIVKNRSLQSLANEFEINLKIIRNALTAHNIVKNPEIIKKKIKDRATKIANDPESPFRTKTIEQKREAQLSGAKSRKVNHNKKLSEQGITHNYLYDLYIIKNKSLKELTVILNLPKSNVRKLLKRFNIKKTHKMILEAQRKNLKVYYADEEKVKIAVTKGQMLISERYGNNWYRVNASSQETELLNFIQEKFPKFIVKSGDYSVIKNPETNAALQLDIYIPEINFAIEFNGEYWHDRIAYENDLLNDTVTTRERVKEQACKKQGILLLHIWDTDYKKDKVNIMSKISLKINDIIDHNQY